MFDAERVKRDLQSLDVYRMQLVGMLPKSLDEYKSFEIGRKYAAERLVQLLSDTEMDIVVSLYRKAEARPSGDVETMVESLGAIFSRDIIQDINELRKLRNSLVHAYAGSNYDKEVFAIAGRTKALERFMESVKRALAT